MAGIRSIEPLPVASLNAYCCPEGDAAKCQLQIDCVQRGFTPISPALDDAHQCVIGLTQRVDFLRDFDRKSDTLRQ